MSAVQVSLPGAVDKQSAVIVGVCSQTNPPGCIPQTWRGLPDGGEAACSYSNYVAANGCSGLGSTEEAKEEKGGGEGAGGDDREAAEALLACMAKSPPEDWWAALANCTAAAPSFLSSPPPSSSPEVYHCYDGDTRQAFPMVIIF